MIKTGARLAIANINTGVINKTQRFGPLRQFYSGQYYVMIAC